MQETIDTTARIGKSLKVPGEPTLAERKQHELTHLPYCDWCEHCVKAKGGHGPVRNSLIDSRSLRLTTVFMQQVRTSH